MYKEEAVSKLQEGLGWMDKGKMDQAESAFQAAIALDDRLGSAYNNLGLVMLGKGLVERALASFETAVAKDNRLPSAFNNMGAIAQSKGEFEKALDLYQKAVQIAPEYLDAYYNTGILHSARKEWAKARANFEKVIRIDSHNLKGYFALASVYGEMNELYEAMANYLIALRLDPDFYEASLGLAEMLRRQGKFDLALLELGRLHQKFPDDASVYSREGLIYLEVGRPTEATRAFVEACRIDPQDVGNKEILAVLLASAGQTEDAVRVIQEAIIQEPGNKELQETLRQIESERVTPL